MPDYKTYRLRITVLSPLHIGNGREMLNEYDYVIYNGHTWRINENALLDAQNVEDPRVAEMLARQKPAHLLKPEDFKKDSPLFRYILKGAPKSRAEGAVLREQIKDAFDRPYLPGTTIKGAIRTALAWQLWQKKNLRPEIARLNPTPKFAASTYERDLFGENSNNDLLRALHITDSTPLDTNALMLVNVRVLTRGGKPGSPIEVEAIRRDTVIESQLKLDTALFSQWAREREFYLHNGDALMNFVEIARQYSLNYIQQEIEWVKGMNNGKYLVSFYDTMLKFTLSRNQFYLQLGWGAGWEQKTFGSHLKKDDAFMRTILKPRKQGGWDVGRGHMPKNVKDFPVSRRIAMAYQRSPQGEINAEIPALPLGWVLVTVESTDGGELFTPPRSQSQQQPSPAPTKPQAAAPAPQPGKPAAPRSKPAEKPLIASFKDIPRPGDRFRGLVFSDYKGEMWLEIPGLNPDEQAYAVLLRSENPLLGKVKEKQSLECEAVAAEEESSGYWRVKCRFS